MVCFAPAVFPLVCIGNIRSEQIHGRACSFVRAAGVDMHASHVQPRAIDPKRTRSTQARPARAFAPLLLSCRLFRTYAPTRIHHAYLHTKRYCFASCWCVLCLHVFNSSGCDPIDEGGSPNLPFALFQPIKKCILSYLVDKASLRRSELVTFYVSHTALLDDVHLGDPHAACLDVGHALVAGRFSDYWTALLRHVSHVLARGNNVIEAPSARHFITFASSCPRPGGRPSFSTSRWRSRTG